MVVKTELQPCSHSFHGLAAWHGSTLQEPAQGNVSQDQEAKGMMMHDF